MKHRLLPLALAMSMLLACAAPAAAQGTSAKEQIVATRQAIVRDGKLVTAEVYNIDGYNYFKLRDVAAMLNGTDAQFDIVVDEAARTANIVSGQGYTVTGGELTAGADQSSTCVKSSWKLQRNGVPVDINAYSIGGSNFFRLSELGKVIGFGVAYNQSTNTVSITSQGASLVFDENDYVEETVMVDGVAVTSRSFKNVPYVSSPVDAEQQVMNIYVPAGYYEGKTINGYTAQTAPIYFLISVGGYMQGALIELDTEASINDCPTNTVERRANALSVALSQGYVVVSPAARGRNSDASEGVGKGVAGLADLKAAVRYLRYNDARMPGDAEKIISEGQSAGGAMSSLVAISGNNPYFDAELTRIGAADERDDVYACISFCPITDLEYANNAYEWLFNDESAWTGGTGFPDAGGVLTHDEEILSDVMKSMYPAYLNSLGLEDPETGAALTLNADGTGSYLDYLEKKLAESANKGLADGFVGTENITAENGFALENGVVTDADLHAYVLSDVYNRMKPTGAFDNGIIVWTGENNQFTLGTTAGSDTHFDATLSAAVSAANAKGANITGLNGASFNVTADNNIVTHMNPMNYLVRNQYQSDKANYFYIRVGAKDADTSLTISANLALALEKYDDAEVNYAMRWGLGHTGQYDLGEEFEWLNTRCR